MRLSRLAISGAFASFIGLTACGGGGYSSPPTAPSPAPTPAPTSSAEITILGDRGSQSFTPNPSPATGGMASFRNTDNLVHRIVANDGSFDTGNISPGQTSAAKAVAAAGVNFHCTIHPGMVGAISPATGSATALRGDLRLTR